MSILSPSLPTLVIMNATLALARRCRLVGSGTLGRLPYVSTGKRAAVRHPLLYSLCSIALFASAAAPTCAVRHWGLSPTDSIEDGYADPAGNLYALVYRWDGQNWHAELTKHDPAGQLVWSSQAADGVGINRPDWRGQLAIDAAGNAYVAITILGRPDDPTVQQQDATVAKYDPSGLRIWEARIQPEPVSLFEAAVAVAVEPQSGVLYASAHVVRPADRAEDREDVVETIKYAADGNQEWTARHSYRGGTCCRAPQIAVMPDGGVVIAAESASPGAASVPNPFGITMRYGVAGDLLWSQRSAGLPGPLTVDSGGAVYVVVRPPDTSVPHNIQKYAPSGELLWTVTFPGGWVTDMETDATGNLYVTGADYGFGFSPTVTTVGYGASGELLWSARHVAETGYGVGAGPIALDKSGNAYVAAFHGKLISDMCHAKLMSVAVMKYDPAGAQQWLTAYDFGAEGAEAACDVATKSAIAVDARGDVLVVTPQLVIKYVQVE